MAILSAAKTVAGAAMCAALLVTGCQAVPDQPGTNPQSAPATPVPSAVPQAEVLAAVAAAAGLRDLPATITAEELLAASGDYAEQWSLQDCDPTLQQSRLDDLGPCTLGDTTSARTMVLLGDSAASMWHSAFDLIGERAGWRVIVLAKSNCGPAALTYYQWQLERPYTECDDWQDWRMDVIDQQKAEIVVMTGFFDGGNQGPDKDTTPEIWRDALVQTIRELPVGTRTFTIGNIARPSQSPSECVADNPSDLTRCAEPAVDVLPAQDPWAQAAELTGQTYINIDPWFCTDVCPAVIAERLVYSGKYHVTRQYAEYLSGSMAEVMAPALR